MGDRTTSYQFGDWTLIDHVAAVLAVVSSKRSITLGTLDILMLQESD